MAERAIEAPIRRYFNVIHQSLNRLGQPVLPADTPQEICCNLKNSLPVASQEISQLQNEYHKFMFSQHPTDVVVARRASILIRKHTNRAVLNKFINQVKKGLKLSH